MTAVDALLRRARTRSGMTQAQVAAAAGTSQPVISAYERGQRDPTVQTLRRLVAATGARLELSATSAPHSGPPPCTDPAEHGHRLLDVLALADAIPRRRVLHEPAHPRMVSVR